MFGITGGFKKTHQDILEYLQPSLEQDIYNGRNIFLKLNKLQNYFYDLEENYGEREKKNQQGMACMASRFQQYPSGGGFLAPYDDGQLELKRIKT